MGLLTLSIRNFSTLETALDAGVQSRLIAKSPNVISFEISECSSVTEEALDSLLSMGSQIINQTAYL